MQRLRASACEFRTSEEFGINSFHGKLWKARPPPRRRRPWPGRFERASDGTVSIDVRVPKRTGYRPQAAARPCPLSGYRATAA